MVHSYQKKNKLTPSILAIFTFFGKGAVGQECRFVIEGPWCEEQVILMASAMVKITKCNSLMW